MPVKDNGCVLNLFDTQTGNKIGTLDRIRDVSIDSDYKTDYGYDTNNKKEIWRKYYPTYEISFTSNKLTDELKGVLGIDKSNTPDTYNIQFTKAVQARKHKKKRINKKWLKRYGYKHIVVECNDCKLKSYDDGTVEFVK